MRQMVADTRENYSSTFRNNTPLALSPAPTKNTQGISTQHRRAAWFSTNTEIRELYLSGEGYRTIERWAISGPLIRLEPCLNVL